MQHDDDHDCDIEIHLNPFLLITVGAPPLGTIGMAPIFPPRERLSCATMLSYQHLLDELNHRMAPGLPASAFDEASSGSFSGAAANAAREAFRKRLTSAAAVGLPNHKKLLDTMPGAALPGSIVKLENIGPDGDTAYLVSPEGIAFAGMEANARTWGDHGDLFELPNGWRFQDNMIQSALGEPGDNLFAVITYDADNLPNPWEWQLHEAASSDPDALWEEVPTTPDKPRAGWAPTLLAAMTRARTAGSLHLDDRRAAAGGA